MNKSNNKCFNCVFSGFPFKIDKLTHMHCDNPEYVKGLELEGRLSPWETLRIFSDSCGKHQLKTKNDE